MFRYSLLCSLLYFLKFKFIYFLYFYFYTYCLHGNFFRLSSSTLDS